MRSRSLYAMILIPACLLMLGGCRKKPPKTTADLNRPVTTAAPAEPAPAPTAPDSDLDDSAPAPADPLEGDDLGLINEYVFRQALVADIFFSLDRAELSEDARTQLARNARFLQDHPRFSLTLEGHCDERGTNEYNLALGERRATAARGYLTSLGVEPERLRTISYGEERPVCQETEEGCWQQNRRVHPVVTGRSGG